MTDMALRILRGFIPAMKAYTAPPRREWQGLTEEEISHIYVEAKDFGFEVARAVETALKEKNRD